PLPIEAARSHHISERWVRSAQRALPNSGSLGAAARRPIAPLATPTGPLATIEAAPSHPKGGRWVRSAQRPRSRHPEIGFARRVARPPRIGFVRRRDAPRNWLRSAPQVDGP